MVPITQKRKEQKKKPRKPWKKDDKRFCSEKQIQPK